MNNTVDYFSVDGLLSQEYLLVRDAVRNFVQLDILPQIESRAQQNEEIPDLMRKLGSIGALGPFIPEKYGGAGLDYMAYGLIMQELEFGDSAVRSAASVQSSLVMYPIFSYGSEEQKQKYLPKLAKGEYIGAFGLTESNHGSDPAGMETKLVKDEGGYRLNGTKTWITNAPTCDIAIVWAKDDIGRVRGVIVERGDIGFFTPEIKHKWSLRASKTGELVFDHVFIPNARVLAEVSSMRGPLSCLNSARYGISWGAIGAAVCCYQTALQYAIERSQFGSAIASKQIQQKKLAEMITEITKAQLMAWRLGGLRNENKATPEQISMAKRNNVNMALQVAREARQVLGAMGIVGDYPIMRHMMNLESVITYEGTHDIHLLITGQDITGINGF